MSNQHLIARFCPACGAKLEDQTCANRLCPQFGVKVNLCFGKKEIILETNDTPFVVNNRQLFLLVDRMEKSQQTAYWEQLAKASHEQLLYIAQACQELCCIEKSIRHQPLSPKSREKTINQLNRIAAILEDKADFACLINRKASAVVQADLILLSAQEKLESDQRIYQAIKDQEAKNA